MTPGELPSASSVLGWNGRQSSLLCVPPGVHSRLGLKWLDNTGEVWHACALPTVLDRCANCSSPRNHFRLEEASLLAPKVQVITSRILWGN